MAHFEILFFSKDDSIKVGVEQGKQIQRDIEKKKFITINNRSIATRTIKEIVPIGINEETRVFGELKQQRCDVCGYEWMSERTSPRCPTCWKGKMTNQDKQPITEGDKFYAKIRELPPEDRQKFIDAVFKAGKILPEQKQLAELYINKFCKGVGVTMGDVQEVLG